MGAVGIVAGVDTIVGDGTVGGGTAAGDGAATVPWFVSGTLIAGWIDASDVPCVA